MTVEKRLHSGRNQKKKKNFPSSGKYFIPITDDMDPNRECLFYDTDKIDPMKYIFSPGYVTFGGSIERPEIHVSHESDDQFACKFTPNVQRPSISRLIEKVRFPSNNFVPQRGLL